MFKNYLTIMFRNMVKNKLFTFINIFGISVSLACCILLFLYATRELSYDKHHGPDVYRITSDIQQKDGEKFHIPTTSIPVAPVIKEQIPDIEWAARITNTSVFGGKDMIKKGTESWFSENGYVVDSSIFKILQYHFVSGNIENPLPHINSVVLEQAFAHVIFGDEDPIGKVIEISSNFDESDFEVSAIYDKKKYLTHVNPDFMISSSNASWNTFFNRFSNNWVGNNLVMTYVKLNPKSQPDQVDEKIHKLLLQYGGEMMKETGLYKEMDLQPVTEIHTAQGYMLDIFESTNPVFIRVLILIGILILILACVNYINLSTAKAGSRALEVGIRKVLGINSRGLIFQFLGESFIIIFIALLFSLLLAYLSLPYFNQLISHPITFDTQLLPLIGLYLLGFLLFTGIIAGFYPAFYLASFQPSQVLKGKNRDKTGTSLIRKGLVVFQFIISISLISAIIIISEQISFIKNKDLGFRPDSKLVIPFNTSEARGQYKVFKNSLQSNAMVKKVSGGESIPGMPLLNDLLVYKEGQTMDDAIHIYNNTVDLGFMELLDIQLISGNYFHDYDRDTLIDPIMISEEGIKLLGIDPEDAPGRQVYFDWQGNKMTYEIVGVFSNFHQFSLHQAIDPFMFSIGDEGNNYQYVVLDASMNDFPELIRQIEQEWKALIPNEPLSYFTIDDQLMKQYEGDLNTFNLIKYFAIISILISCLGLYAMSMYMAERRFKEIGIRKTFGAGIRNIIIMVSADLSKLIFIAYIVSIPITIYGMNVWLDTFVYRIHPGAMIYLLAGMLTMLIAWITISYQSIRVAYTNPVKVLREE